LPGLAAYGKGVVEYLSILAVTCFASHFHFEESFGFFKEGKHEAIPSSPLYKTRKHEIGLSAKYLIIDNPI
jgi:hypothetical protein